MVSPGLTRQTPPNDTEKIKTMPGPTPYYAWLAENNGPRICKLKAQTLQEAIMEIGEEIDAKDAENEKPGVYTIFDHTIFEGQEGVLALLEGISDWYADRLSEMSEEDDFTLGEQMEF